MVRFDWVINFGTMIHLVSFLVTLLILYVKMAQSFARWETRLGIIEAKVDALWKAFAANKT